MLTSLPPSEAESSVGDTISVAILTCNRLSKLQRCLESVVGQLSDADEIVVLDTGSMDGTREWLSEQKFPIRSLFSTSVRDFAGARNDLAAACTGSVVVFLDDDCYPMPGWLDRARRDIVGFDAVGGLVLPCAGTVLPFWWNDEFGWTAGMSSCGVWAERDGCYPATANMAVRRDILLRMQFASTGHHFSEGNVYLSGREDAHWWLAARRAGLKLRISPKMAVEHDVNPSRFTLRSILRRAYTDGVTAWAREANPVWVSDACTDFGSSVLRAPLLMCSPVRRLPQIVWSVRQFGLMRASGRGVVGGTVAGLKRAVQSHMKIVTGDLWAGAIGLKRGEFHIPEQPGHVLIVAPSFLGDAVLLQAAVHQLSYNIPSARIEVLTPYPQLFSACSSNVMALPMDTLDEENVPRDMFERADVVFAPYWHRFDVKLWRHLFSAKGITFNEDVGFPRRLDYLLARRRVSKRYTRNEAINLSLLLHRWPARVGLSAPRLVADAELLASLLCEQPVLSRGRYALVQVDTAQNMKMWPKERWLGLADVLVRRGLGVGVISAEANSEAAILLRDRFGANHVADLGGCSILELLSWMSGASIAVGGCSGPKHLAFGLRVPTFTVYGPMKPDRWGPLSDHAIHGGIVSPVPYLTRSEVAGQPVNTHMLRVSAEAASAALLSHLVALGL